jgi:multidrug efflux pump subunit AcrA (membrane-fusion protein)
VLVATGYVVARRNSDVGVKTGGRFALLTFEEGTRVRRGEIIARLEHGEAEAQLDAARHAVSEAEAQLLQVTAARNEAARSLERQQVLNSARSSKADTIREHWTTASFATLHDPCAPGIDS